jgi:ribose/xylose/arabinose/galactoside ABC-type transport system permease subunit
LGGWVVGWLGGWVVGWLGGWVVGWLGGWVVGWLGVPPFVWMIHEGVELVFVAKRLYRVGDVPAGYKPFAAPASPECG